MAFDSFSDFLDILANKNELIRIPFPCATELEITQWAYIEMKKNNGGKALLFEKPSVNQKISRFPLAINCYGSDRRMAICLGEDSLAEAVDRIAKIIPAAPPMHLKDLAKLFTTAIDLRHAKPKFVNSGPCKEVIHLLNTKDKIPTQTSTESNQYFPTILDLPILKCWPKDAGRFITLPCVVTQDPDTGIRNIGMYRMQVFDPQLTGLHWQPQKTGAIHFYKYKQKNLKMPVSVFLGGDPVFAFCAAAPLPEGIDEFILAGFLRRKSVELVKCETNPLEVPANADVVIEGYVDPTEDFKIEGPFGDHTGFYTNPEPYPVFHITAITHKKNAVYPATIVGKPPMEDYYFGNTATKLLMPILKLNFPELVDIAFPAEGVFHNLVFVSIKKTYPWQAYKIMHGLWGMGQMMFSKYIIVVDDSVNVHDTKEVLFHLGANTDPQHDCIFSQGPADALDHATRLPNMGTKLGIDATKKLPGEGFNRPWPEPIEMPKDIKERVENLIAKLDLQ